MLNDEEDEEEFKMREQLTILKAENVDVKRQLMTIQVHPAGCALGASRESANVHWHTSRTTHPLDRMYTCACVRGLECARCLSVA